jgi:prepilin signal peptidase PulO-like enzyme (type II secretory pathway)
VIFIFLFVLGLIIGSFLNVIGLRFRSGKGLGGRSFCVACYKPLHWYELVPVVSFISQGGKCGGCATKISWQYPVVELITAIVFVTIFNPNISLLINPLLFAYFSILIVITIYDYRHKIIPDELAYSAIIAGFIYRLLMDGSSLDWMAPLVIFTFFILIWLATRGRAIGLGDAKLGASMGFVLGASSGFSAVVLAFWIGAFVAILIMFLGRASLLDKDKRLTMKSEIPFAPFLVLATWISFVFNLNILHVPLF